MTLTSAALLAAWAVIALLSLAMSGLIRQFRVLEAQVTASASGMRVRRDVAALLSALGVLDHEVRTCLVFVEQGCSACHRLLADLPELANHLSDVRIRLVPLSGNVSVVGGDSIEVAEHAAEVAAIFDVTATPYFALLSQRGDVLIEGPVANAADLTSALLSTQPQTATS